MDNDIRRQMAALLPRLRRFALVLTGSQHESDDLLQMACERALARADQWRPHTRLDSWMFRIMQTAWLNEVRALQIRARHEPELEVWRAVAAHGEHEVETRDLLCRVHDEIARLPEEQCVVLVLVCVEGMTYREAAEVASIPIGTVMIRLARARLALMRQIEGADDVPPDNLVRLRAG